jgi:hypothetical protein
MQEDVIMEYQELLQIHLIKSSYFTILVILFPQNPSMEL